MHYNRSRGVEVKGESDNDANTDKNDNYDIYTNAEINNTIDANPYKFM